MNKFIYILLFFLLSANFLTGQQKYFIYFSDKGNISKKAPAQDSPQFQKAESLLTPKSIERRKKVMGENFITYEDIPINKNYIDSLENMGIQIVRKLRWFNAVSVYMKEEDITQLAQQNYINKIEPVKTISYKRDFSTEKPSERLYKSKTEDLDYGLSEGQLALSEIPEVHKLGIDGSEIVIGLLDSGFDWKNHISLENISVLYEYDFVQDDTVTADQEGDVPGQHNHGTMVLSVVGGFDNSSLIGSAFGSQFMLTKTEDLSGETHVEEDNYAASLQEMEARGVDITSSSLGYSTFDTGEASYTYQDMDGNTTIVTRAVNKAFQRGVVTVTSAGNEGNKPWHYITAPADAYNVISVGAVSNANNLAGFSSEGPTADGRTKPEVLAQGISVVGASTSKNSYNYSSGTSLSAPIVAGAAALLLDAHPYLKNSQVRKILLESSDNAQSPDNERGYGLLSALEAVKFPNLQVISGKYRVNKIFKSNSDSDHSNHKIVYRVNDNNDILTAEMKRRDSLAYYFQFPELPEGDIVTFHFEYEDSAGNIVSIPEETNYKMIYGNLGISLNTDISDSVLTPIPENYIMYQNYPNPFNGVTTIRFDAKETVPFKLTIFNSIGQKIDAVGEGIAEVGSNYVTWDGKNNKGIKCASGLYLYHLKIAGEQFTKKLLFLK